jgi:hypothetical protein
MTKAKQLIFQNNKVLFFILASASVASLVVYIISVNLTVRNVVKRQAIETELSRITAEISELEFAYIDQKNGVTFELATDLGFEKVTKSKFVSRQFGVAVVATDSQRR